MTKCKVCEQMQRTKAAHDTSARSATRESGWQGPSEQVYPEWALMAGSLGKAMT